MAFSATWGSEFHKLFDFKYLYHTFWCNYFHDDLQRIKAKINSSKLKVTPNLFQAAAKRDTKGGVEGKQHVK